MRPTITIHMYGPQGSGKSQLARTLLKFIATQGYDTYLPEEGCARLCSSNPTVDVVIQTTNSPAPEL